MQRYSRDSYYITTKYVKVYGFESFARKYKKQSLNTGLDTVRTVSRKVAHIAGEFIGNKIADTVTKSNDNKIVTTEENPRNVEEVIIPIKKREEILNKLRQVLL